jgi:uncharacterized tellurite resistance protein B-like protein
MKGGYFMELLTNKEFGNTQINVYSEENTFYMTRKQLSEALEYNDDKSLARIITRNRDAIGDGKTITLTQTEGDRVVTRDVEVFSFLQIFQMLRFSKQPKANAFMEFTALTMKQLLTGKAEIVFADKKDAEAYTKHVKNILAKCKSFGITKTKASLLIQSAEITGSNPDALIMRELQEKHDMEKQKRRGIIYEMINYLATVKFAGDHEEAWHRLSTELKYTVGVNMRAIRNRIKKTNERLQGEGLKKQQLPSYLDLIEQYNAFKEAKKAIRKLVDILPDSLDPKIEEQIS